MGMFRFCLLVLLVSAIVCPPALDDKKRKELARDAASDDEKDTDRSTRDLENLEYGRYLKEVVDILENDSTFKKMIDNASIDDIRSGSIAQHLNLVEHNVRTKLDEAKQREMERLRHLIAQQVRLANDRARMNRGRGMDAKDPSEHIRTLLPQHVDHHNMETFGALDLEKLIRKASKDLDDLDKRREKEFKDYELRKEYERRQKLARVAADERRKLESEYQARLEKKKQHPKVNHPGSVSQLEEVWEEVDHLEPDQFNPKAFFTLHDTNSDGFLDEGEIEAIMLKEAEKIHNNSTDGDPVERKEEMDRMREHVMNEFDRDRNRMLSYEEFQQGVNGTGAKNDNGWESIEDKPVFSDQDFQAFSDEMSHLSSPMPPVPHQENQPPQHQPSSVPQQPPPAQQGHQPPPPPAANLPPPHQ